MTTAKWYKCKVIDTTELKYGFSKGQMTYCRKGYKDLVVVWSGGINNHAIRQLTQEQARKHLVILEKMDDKFNKKHESDYNWVLNY